MSEIKFSNENGGSMTDAVTGEQVTWLSKNRVRLTEEGNDPVALAKMLKNLADEILEWAGRLDAMSDHRDLEQYFRLSVTLGQPRSEMKPTNSSGSMANMDLDDDDGEDDVSDSNEGES